MEFLFTYGSLQWEQVQRELLHRKLTGYPDLLQGFRLMEEKTYGQYPVIRACDNVLDKVAGIVYEVTKAELQITDDYEGKDYLRIKTTLASGKAAWVYVGK
tara:strand:- start:1466 stop:1768 length:303 start_codon:yes stop_codon:yes gene_type:complete